MATRGKPPKSPAEKKLRGGRKDRQPKPAAALEAGRPECPRYLCDVAKAEWEEITSELERRGILTPQDGRYIAIYCDAYARWRVAREELAEYGPVLHSESGAVKANPAAAVANQLARLMCDQLAQWGMTPLGRLRFKPADEQTDQLGEFLAG